MTSCLKQATSKLHSLMFSILKVTNVKILWVFSESLEKPCIHIVDVTSLNKQVSSVKLFF